MKIREFDLSTAYLVAYVFISFKSNTNADLIEDEEEHTFFINSLIDSADCIKIDAKMKLSASTTILMMASIMQKARPQVVTMS